MLAAQNVYDFTVGKILNAAFIETHRNWEMRDICFPDLWTVCYSVDGHVTYTMGDTHQFINRDDVVFFPPGHSRSAHSSPSSPWKFIVVKFRLYDVSPETEKFLRAIPILMKFPSQMLLQRFKELDIAWKTKKPGYLVKCKGLIYAIMYTIMSEAMGTLEYTKHAKQLSEVLTVIANNQGDNYTVQNLSEMVGFSPSYFNAIFKQYTGFTPIRYQNYIKMQRAHDLLACGNYTSAEVAELVGINDEFYFSRLFKQVIGISPSKIGSYLG